MTYSETMLIQTFLKSLIQRLPCSWKAQVKSLQSVPRRDFVSNAFLTLTAPGRVKTTFPIVVKSKLEPKFVSSFLAKVRESLPNRIEKVPFVVADYLGPSTRVQLIKGGAGYWDTAGNFRLTLERPALFIEVTGAEKNPWPDQRSLHSLRGPAAGRAIRALCDFKPPFGIRELATRSKIAAPSLSRVVNLLDQELMLQRESARGRITSVDWPAIIRRWVKDYGFIKSNRVVNYLEPRGLKSLLEKLARSSHQYAVTGSLAAEAIGTAVTAARLAMIYVTNITVMAETLNLRVAEAGANVMLAEPFDEVVFERTIENNGMNYVAPTQMAADLLTSPGRGPADAEALIQWMQENERAWRS